MTIAMFSFLGIVIGASLQYLFTRYLENQRHYRKLRTQAYTDYLRGVSEHAHLVVQRQGHEAREIFSRTADAKARICLYGSTAAIQALSSFENLGATMNTDKERTAFASMVLLMRNDSGSQPGTKIEEVETVLLGRHGVKT